MSNPNSPSNVEAIYPLSPLQQGMLVDSLYTTELGVYTVQLCVTLEASIVADPFRAVWQMIVNRHPILRTVFVWEHQKPLQIVLGQVELPWVTYDWRDDPDRAAKLADLLKRDQDQGFKLDQAPLMRFTFIQTCDAAGQAVSYFVWTLHHILMDAWCMSIVLKEVFALYAATQQEQPLTLATPRPYRDYITWLQQQERSELEQYWRQTLSGLSEPTPLPVAETVLAKGTFADPYQRLPDFYLSEPLSNALRTLARQQRLTLNTLFQGAWALLLSRYTGQADILFGVTVAGRPPTLTGADGMVGLFINTLPARLNTPAGAKLLPWLQQVQQQQVSREQYAHSSLIDIQGWSAIPRSRRLFETILVYENYPMDPALFAAQGGPVQALTYTDKINYPLCLVVEPGAAIRLEMRYDATLFSPAAVTRLLGHFQSLLEGMVTQPEATLDALPLLSTAEREHLLVTWNNTATAYPRHETIHTRFAAQAARTPDAVAVTLAGDVPRSMTYRQLDERANQVAHHLQTLGVESGTPVGLCVERSLELLVGLLGILKAGGVYVPLDPTYPSERLAFLLADTATTLLLTQRKLVDRLPTSVQRLCLDEAWAQATRRDAPLTSVTAESLAYIMYTSGSTGQPKGVCVPQRAVVRLVQNTNFLDLGAGQVFLQLAPIVFDASTLELWGPLLNGGRLVLMPPHTPGLAELGAAIRTYGVTTLWLTAGLFHLMVDERLDDLRPLRQLLAGGDVLSPSHVERVRQALPHCQLINGYGPTENTTFTCCYPVPHDQPVGASVPIGRPIANTQVYILDEQRQPVPIGVSGELYAGGDGLALGYHQRPELTAERFVPNPFGPGQLYRTGDQVRYRADGVIEFLGRLDQQVKIRGYRIEPGEIEHILLQHPAVRDTVVIARTVDHDTAPADKQLVAYVVRQAGSHDAIGSAALHDFLAGQVPDYMLPAAFIFLDALPLTPNGKIDRKNLPAPVFQPTPQAADESAAHTNTEATTAAIWCKVLDLPAVGLHDDFFDLGGHSLMATQIVSRMRDAFSVDLLLQDLFDQPTIAELAAYVDQIALQAADRLALEQILNEVAPVFALPK